MAREWNYKGLLEECEKKYDNRKLGYIVTYDFVGRKTGEMPKMFYRHLAKAIEKGLLIERIEKSVYHCSESGRYFLVKLVKDFNSGAKSKVYKAELEAVD